MAARCRRALCPPVFPAVRPQLAFLLGRYRGLTRVAVLLRTRLQAAFLQASRPVFGPVEVSNPEAAPQECRPAAIPLQEWYLEVRGNRGLPAVHRLLASSREALVAFLGVPLLRGGSRRGRVFRVALVSQGFLELPKHNRKSHNIPCGSMPSWKYMNPSR